MGKSWLALGLCIAVATGGCALGNKPVQQGESLYLSLEDNERRLQDRIIILTDEDTDLSRFHYRCKWSRAEDGGVDDLDAWLEGHPDCRIAVIDTLKKIRTRSSGRRNMYDVDYEAIEPFVPLATKHNVTIVLVHHLNQNPDPSDPCDAFSGSLGLTAAVEGILLLTRDHRQADAILTVDGKDIKDRQELAVKWDAATCTWTIQGQAEAFKMSKPRRDVLGVVEDADQPVTPTYVTDALDKNFEAVKKLMWEMSRDGHLRSNGDGTYSPVTGNRSNPGKDEFTPVTEVTLKAGDPSPPTAKAGNGRRLTEDEALEVRRLMAEHRMSAAMARYEVLREDEDTISS